MLYLDLSKKKEHTEQKAKIKEENNSPKKFGVKAPFFARKSAYCCSL